jgi:glycosyltransferase involved in cell wall biosynthesis
MLDLVKSNVGVLVNPKDADELLHAILYMLDNYQNFDANYIREYAVNMCGKKKVGNLFLEIYRECLLVANGTCPDIYYGN